MKTPHSTQYRYTPETIAKANKLTAGTVAEDTHKRGMLEGEPLIVAMDALLKYAQAYRASFGNGVSGDTVLGQSWLKSICALRELLNGDGAIALERDISTDSKDNGCVESVFWSALKAAGFEEKDIL